MFFPHIITWGSCFSVAHPRLRPSAFPAILCRTQLCHTHTQLCDAQLFHTRLCHTQLCRARLFTPFVTSFPHTTLSRAIVSRATLSPQPCTVLCGKYSTSGVPLRNIEVLFVWQAWYFVWSLVVRLVASGPGGQWPGAPRHFLALRQGTYGTGLLWRGSWLVLVGLGRSRGATARCAADVWTKIKMTLLHVSSQLHVSLIGPCVVRMVHSAAIDTTCEETTFYSDRASVADRPFPWRSTQAVWPHCSCCQNTILHDFAKNQFP